VVRQRLKLVAAEVQSENVALGCCGLDVLGLDHDLAGQQPWFGRDETTHIETRRFDNHPVDEAHLRFVACMDMGSSRTDISAPTHGTKSFRTPNLLDVPGEGGEFGEAETASLTSSRSHPQ